MVGAYSGKGTFNEYLAGVEHRRRVGTPRDKAHWETLSAFWPEKAESLREGKYDPRGMCHKDIDAWLSWLVVEWNRVS